MRLKSLKGVKISDEPGKLSEALRVLNDNKINMEYLYAFTAHTEKHACVVIRVEDNDKAETALSNAGFEPITEDDVSAL